MKEGDWVTVKSEEEIKRYSYSEGEYFWKKGLHTFLPEMFRYCGQSFRILKVYERTSIYEYYTLYAPTIVFFDRWMIRPFENKMRYEN